MPSIVRENGYFRANYPGQVAHAESAALTKLWSRSTTRDCQGDEAIFDELMGPYLGDPFRGTVERRVLGPGESAQSIQTQACRDALEAAGMTDRDVDLLISSAFFPDRFDVGNAVFLVEELGLACPGWNLESACTSSVLAYETACSLARAGLYENILVTVACTYSSATSDTDSLSWWLGDGAAAFVVGPVVEGRGFIASHTIHTAETCRTFYQEICAGPQGARRVMKTSPGAGAILRSTAGTYVRSCCEQAARKAGVRLGDIDFFVFNTPNAWYAPYCARILGVSEERCIDVYRRYGNIGPALMPVTLFHALAAERIRDGDLVMLYAVGSSSTASASVTRWGETKLGPLSLRSIDG
jgi:3-oxoacyl-[acyl-carrier-protein] synthase-3